MSDCDGTDTAVVSFGVVEGRRMIPPGNVFASRRADVTATRMNVPFEVDVGDEVVSGNVGDWLVQSVVGELSVVTESVFRELFDPRSSGALEEFRGETVFELETDIAKQLADGDGDGDGVS